jgi:PAS domain S-box-containing protein
LTNLTDINERETLRFSALANYAVMDTPREQSFDELAALTAKLCDVPIAVINFIGMGRQFFKAEVGLGVRETPLESSFCVKAMLEEELLVVPDLTKDSRFDCNPLVCNEPHIRSYAGVLLKTDDGLPIGTLCVLDHRPREFTALHQETLRVLARQVMAQLDLRRAVEDRDRRYAELQSSEERLHESDVRYRTLFDSLESGFCVIEVDQGSDGAPIDYRVVEANPAFYQQTGFEKAVLGRWLREAVPDLEEHFYENYGRVARSGEPVRFEQGSAVLGRWFDIYAFRIGEGAEHRVAILFNDISARRTAEEALQQLNETLEDQIVERTAERDRMWDTSPDLMLVIDFDGVFRRVNPAWTDLLGYERDELVGRHVNDFVLAVDHGETVAAYEAAKSGRKPQLENRYRHKDGSVRWISWVAAPAGELTYATGRDITLDKERETELAAAQEQLRQAQKMEAVGQLTGGLAHDFNNLLTGMMGNMELLQSRVARGRLDDLDRFILAAQAAGRRAAALTQRLLAFSRRQTLDPKPTDVNRLIAGMEDMLRRTVGPATVIEVVGAAGLWSANIDAGQLENALLNLCINARDAMPDGGRLTIETANRWLDDRSARERDLPAGQYLSVCVTDSGTGMSKDTIEHAFEPFFTTKPLGEGTGLGLSMIYGFARQSNGQVRIYSELGMGTSICIYLPRHIGDAVPPGQVQAMASAAVAGRETVLVVDDEATIRLLIDEVLGDAGYTVLSAADGAAALEVLRAGTGIELLITDVGLPNGMNGRQVADAARLLRPGLKVLFITGYAENAAVGNGHLEPGMELLTKPFTLEALTTKVAEIMV